MDWTLSSYSVALALTALTLAGLAIVAWSRRANTRGARSFTFFMIAGMIWAGLEAVQLADPDPWRQLMWLQLKYLGVAFVPVAFLTFANDYTRQGDWVNRFTIVLLLIVPVVTVSLAWTNEWHHVFWREVGTEAGVGRTRLVTQGGDWFWVHAGYSYLLLALGTFYMLRGYVLTPRRYRFQVTLVLVAVIVPWFANALSLGGVVTLSEFDLTPLVFSFSALAFARSLFSHRLLDIVPVAQETVMRYLSDAVVVADARQRVLQVNPEAARLLGVDDPSAVVGQKTADLFMHAPALLERLGTDAPDQLDVVLPTPVGTRNFNVHLTPLADRRGRITGHLVRLQDIERQVQAEHTLHEAETTLKQQEQYVKALQDVSEGLVVRRPLDAMLEEVLHHAAKVLDAPHGFIDLVDADRGVLQRVRSVGRFALLREMMFRPGEGLAGKVWKAGAPMRVEDYKHWPGRVRGVGLEWVRGAISAPLIANGDVMGVLTLARVREDRRPFTVAEETLLTRFTQLGAIALQNVRLIEEIEARRRESEQLTRIATAMQEASSLQDRMDLILHAIKQMVGLERAVIWLPTEAGIELQASSWTGFGVGEGIAGYRVPLDGSVPVLSGAYLHGEEIVLEADQVIPERYRATGAMAASPVIRSRALAALPLISRGRTIGVLAVDNPESRRPLEGSMPTLRRVVASAAVAIDSARLYESVQQELAERKAAEGELRRSEEKYRTILEQIEDSYFETDPRGRFTLVNPALAAGVLDVGERMIGRSFRHYIASDVRSVLEAFHTVAKTGTAVQRQEVRYRRLDGSEWYGEWSIGRVLDDDGALVGFRGLVRNIEDRKRYELELQDAKELAEAANASKSAFLANVSHELRTPLTSILGFARLIERRFEEVLVPLLEGHEDRKVQRAVTQVRGNAQIIYRESQRLTSLINGVLDLAKIEAGRIDWNMQRLLVGDVVRRALEATHGLTEARPEIRVVADLARDVHEVDADPDRLVQVIINLISNAVKFTPAGDVTVRVETRGDRVVVSVRDTGIGIAPADHAAVFEQFKQVGDTLTEKPQGTGLGLPICKQIVEHHGGRIWLESAIGSGSTFFFDLPVAAPADAPPAEGPPLEPVLRARHPVEVHLNALRGANGNGQTGDPGSTPPPASGTPHGGGDVATILVVDDDEQIRALLRQELEEAGHAVVEAADGRAALAAVETHRPDLVILDVMMPELSGFDVAAVLKNDPVTAGIPIVILTVAQDPRRGDRLGVERYLTKPVDMPTLLSEVQGLLSPVARRRT